MDFGLKDYLAIIRKRLILIVSFVLVCCVTSGLVSAYLVDPVYQASTKLIVNQSEQAVGIDTVDLNSVNLNIRLIDTYKEIIKTPAIMNIVAEENPEFGLTARELSSKVKVSSVNNTQVMTLVVEDESYQLAAKIVNAVSLVFQREISKIMNVDNVSILNEAPLDATPGPVKPIIKLNIAISFLVSLLVSLGIAILIEYMDDTVKTEQDVNQLLELPTLTMVARTMNDDFEPSHKTTKRKVTDKRAALEQ